MADRKEKASSQLPTDALSRAHSTTQFLTVSARISHLADRFTKVTMSKASAVDKER